VAGILACVVLSLWFLRPPDKPLALRVPGADAAPGGAGASGADPVRLGKTTPGSGQAANLPGAWPQFRGPGRDGLAAAAHLARAWSSEGPRTLWSVPVGDGYAGPAVRDGRVFLMDYDVTNRQDALRCLSLADGQELWRFSYPMVIKRYHGMSRTVPTVTENLVVAITPKCQVLCCDAATGNLRWSHDLVREFGATVPEWYAGQCPLVDGKRVILAPGGPAALIAAVDIETGKVLWQTLNSKGWKMTHSSIMPVEFAGRRQYVYCANQGVVSVAAEDGALLWQTTDWKIGIATVPSPCPLGGDKIFFTGGYGAGSLMLQLADTDGPLSVSPRFKLAAEDFGATQQTPIFANGHLYGTRADGRFVCLSAEGKVLWTSGAGDSLGLGSFLMADGLVFALNDSGQLRLIEATPARYSELARAQVLPNAHDSWGPMALAGTRLLLRDLTRLVCIDVGATP
jgi:outer membrane protein assembly factor BamB